jgi:hypothetical protein
LRRVFLPLLLFHCFFLFLIWRIHIIFYPRLLPVWSFLLVTRDSRVKEKEKGQVRDEEWKLDSGFLHMRSWELLSSWDLGVVRVRDAKGRCFCCERWLEVWVKEHAIQTLGFCHMCL